MLQIRIRVSFIDKHGFQGRTHPPEAQDLGQRGWVTDIELVPDEDLEPTPDVPRPVSLQGAYQVVYAVLDTGRKVELLGHELELVSAVSDGHL